MENVLFLGFKGIFNSEERIKNLIDIYKREHPEPNRIRAWFKVEEYLKSEYKASIDPIFDDMIKRFSELNSASRFDIVWCSPLRVNTMFSGGLLTMREFFKTNGIPHENLVGYTVNLISRRRLDGIPYTMGDEIRIYLRSHKKYDKVAVLDIDPNAINTVDHKNIKLFLVDYKHGFTDEMKNSVIEFFNK